MRVITVFGTSTGYGHFGFWLLEAVLDTIYGGHCRIHCLTSDQLRSSWERKDNLPILITTDRPSADLSQILLGSRCTSFGFVDDPVEAILSAMKICDIDAQKAVRFCAQYFSCLSEPLASERIRMYDESAKSLTFERLVDRLLHDLVEVPDKTWNEKILQQISRINDDDLDHLTVREWLELREAKSTAPNRANLTLSPQDERMVLAVADAYRPMFGGQVLSEVEWPREVFHSDAGERNPPIIHLAGQPRRLVWGPHLHLPKGAWRARVQFEVADNTSGNEVEMEIFIAGKSVTSGRTALPKFGVYACNLDFEVGDPNAPIEVRIRMLSAAIEGKFMLRGVQLQRVTVSSDKPPAVATRPEAPMLNATKRLAVG